MKAFLILPSAALILTPLVNEMPPCSMCRCGPTLSPQDERARADAVFAGRVVSLRTQPDPFPDSVAAAQIPRAELLDKYLEWLLEQHQITIEVSDVWKGEIGPRVEVFAPVDPNQCGVHVALDTEFLIYAQRGSTGRWRTNGCLRTRPLADAKADLAALGRAAAPKRTSNANPPPHNERLHLTSAMVKEVIAIRRLKERGGDEHPSPSARDARR